MNRHVHVIAAALVAASLLGSACRDRSGESGGPERPPHAAREAGSSRTTSGEPGASPRDGRKLGPGPTIEHIRRMAGGAEPGRDLTPDRWRGDARAALALTVDFDAELAYTAFERSEATRGALAAPLSHGSFGARRGLDRLLALFDELDVRATFFVPGVMPRLHPDAVAAIVEAGHPVELHGWTHTDLRDVESRELERRGLRHGLKLLREAGADPTGFRAPYGRLSPHTLELLADSEIRWDASLHGDDYHPYRLRIGDEPSKLIELPQIPYANDWVLFGRPGRLGPRISPGRVGRLWRREFDAAYERGGLFVVTCHPQVIGRPARLEVLRTLVEHARAKSEPVWIAPAGEIAAWIRDQFDL